MKTIKVHTKELCECLFVNAFGFPGKIDADALVKIITTRTSGGKAKALAIHVGEELGLVTFDDFVAMQGVARGWEGNHSVFFFLFDFHERYERD
jgi:hypothetical protein